METARCRAFLAAAETGSFSRAAEALRYTPSGVNQLVSALEKEVGFSLFSRNTKGVALTANGELLLPVVRVYKGALIHRCRCCAPCRGRCVLRPRWGATLPKPLVRPAQPNTRFAFVRLHGA